MVLVAVVRGMSTIAPAMAWVAETDDHAEKACDKLRDLKENKGKPIPGFVIATVCG